jgi:uncharacterized protein (DUF1330 family)
MKPSLRTTMALLLAPVLGYVTIAMQSWAQEAKVANPAYFVAEFQLSDPEGIKPYSAAVESTFRPFGGHFIVRTNHILPLEGEAPKDRFIVIAFDSMIKAQAWYNSVAYSRLRPIRQRSSISRTFIVEGLPR